MDSQNEFLTIEDTLNSIIHELQNVKAASEQIQTIKDSSEIIRGSAETIVLKIGTVVGSLTQLVDSLSKIEFEQEFNNINSEIKNTEDSMKKELIQMNSTIDVNQKQNSLNFKQISKVNSFIVYFLFLILIIQVVLHFSK